VLFEDARAAATVACGGGTAISGSGGVPDLGSSAIGSSQIVAGLPLAMMGPSNMASIGGHTVVCGVPVAAGECRYFFFVNYDNVSP